MGPVRFRSIFRANIFLPQVVIADIDYQPLPLLFAPRSTHRNPISSNPQLVGMITTLLILLS
jgi:hypothetical protein